MDNFKVLFCLFGGLKLRPRFVWTNSTCNIDLPAQGKVSFHSRATPHNKVSAYPAVHLQPLQSSLIKIRRVALILVALVAPTYLMGCGGASVSSQIAPPASTSTGTGTSGTGGTGTTGTTGTGTSGTGSTGSTGTTGTGGAGGTGTTGTGGTGTTAIGGIQETVVSSTGVNTMLKAWKAVCVEPVCAPGGSGVPTATSQTINNTDPSKDGKSMHLSLSSNSASAYTNALWVNVSGNCDNCTRINTDFWVYITSTAKYVNAWEFDSFIFDKVNGYKNMWGMQCVNGSKWEIDSDFGWSSAGIACNLTVGWHHIQVFNHRVINEVGGPKGYGYNYYDALIVDGVYHDLTGTTTPAEAYPKSYTQSSSGFQFQLDAGKNPSAVTIDEYLDMANFYAGN
jgi:hypothetical protein